MRRMYDAAFPPASPPDVDAVAGYIGGNTPHVWTGAEWARQKARYRLPIFVRSHDGDPVADANFSLNWLRNHKVPKGSTLALDYETRVDATYLRAFDAVIVRGGYKTMVYGSRSFVLQNPKPSGGYWTATWNNIPHLDPGAAATQYGGDTTLGKPYDLSVVADSTPLWDTQGDWLTMATKEEVRAEMDAAIRAAKLATHQDILTIINGDPTHPNNLTAIKTTVDALVPSQVQDLSTVDDATLMAEVMRRLAA